MEKLKKLERKLIETKVYIDSLSDNIHLNIYCDETFRKNLLKKELERSLESMIDLQELLYEHLREVEK
jgi:hypothetical protein